MARSKVKRVKGVPFNRNMIKEHGVKVAREVANRAVPALNQDLGSKYDSGRTAFGDARPLGHHGNRVTLFRTGTLRSTLRFDNEGQLLRIKLPVSYARFMIGRFGVLPSGAQKLPFAWSDAIKRLVHEVRVEFGS